MNEYYHQMLSYFKLDGWQFTQYDKANAVRVPYKGTDTEWACIAQTHEEKRMFIYYSICPIKASSSSLISVLEFITMANHNLLMGNFEVDMASGEVRFKTTVSFGEAEWDDELIRTAVINNIFTMDQYIVDLLKVVGGTSTSKEAVLQAESDE